MFTQPFSSQKERLTLDQNKQLCRAAKLRVGGTKKQLIERLQEEDQTSKFGREGFLGFNVDGLKQLCRDRNLQVSGAKFDLVLRILHCDNGTTPEGQTLKRAATDVVKTTDAAGRIVEKHVAKKRKKPAPSASKAYDRVMKKINSVTQKKYQVSGAAIDSVEIILSLST